MKHKLITKGLSVLAVSALISMSGPVRAAEVDLTLAHFMPPISWLNETVFEAWATAVEDESGGRIGVRVFPAQTLGKATAGYDNAVNGVADITWTVQGYTANRFPLTQILELPGMFDTGEVGSCALQMLYDSGALDEEYKDSHVLFLHTHGPGQLHTRGVAVKSLADLEGLRIRRPTAVVGRMLAALGAEPVGMPAPGIYEATQRGVIDGFLLPWEAIRSFRLDEVVDNHTELNLYSLTFVQTMNKEAYENLSPENKQIIDNNSGMRWARIAGAGFDNNTEASKLQALESGTLNVLSVDERQAWANAAAGVTDDYIAELEAGGLPARDVYAAAQGFVEVCRTLTGKM